MPLFFFLFLLFPFTPLLAASASDAILNGIGIAANEAGFGTEEKNTFVFVGGLVSAALGGLGIVFLILLIYAGILYLTSQGEEGHIKKAKRLLSTAVIGILIIAGSYAIANFVIDALISAYT